MSGRVITDNDWTTIGITATAAVAVGVCVWFAVVGTRQQP